MFLQAIGNYLGKLFNGLSVGQKVMTVIAVEVLSYTVITTVAIFQIHIVGNEVRQMANVYLPLFSASEAIRRRVQEKQIHLKDIVFVGDRVVYDEDAAETYVVAKAKFLAASQAIGESLAKSQIIIKESEPKIADDAGVIKGFQVSLAYQISAIRFSNNFHDARVEAVFEHVEDGSFLMGMELLQGVSESEDALVEKLDSLDLILLDLKAASVDYTTGVERISSRLILFASILTVCTVVAIFFFIVKRNISRPLHLLTDAINTFDVKESDPEKSPDSELMSRGDELGLLARSFDALKRDLRAQDAELRRSKEAAEKADRAKSQFLAAASHDLRQPLHAMQMYLAALRRGIERAESLEILSKVESVSITTGRMLNSLLDISQLEAGAIKPNFEIFQVQELLRRLSLSFAPAAQQKGLILHVVPSKLFIRSDPVLLERVVGNFISNAIRYTESGKILVGCRRRGDAVAVEVVDTGIGIPADQMGVIFENFYQVDNAARDRSKGLGLGLAIAERLATCMSHRIEYGSVLGKGSTFGVIVDRADPVQSSYQDTRMANIRTDLSGAKVMLIEDDQVAADATIELLTTWNCDVVWATDGDQAVELATTSRFLPSIILADYRLPGGQDGLRVATAVQLAAGRAIPTIIMTGEGDANKLQEVADMGYLVVRKPVRPAKLRSLINHYLLQPEASAIEP